MSNGFHVPDGNEALRADIPAIVELIERTARWVHPDTFRALPVWAPHTARGRPLYDASWSRRYTNTREGTGITAEKFEGNVAAIKTLVAALDVATPKPKNWSVCHIWGYDDPSFAKRRREIEKRKAKIREDLANAKYIHYPKADVESVLKFWSIELG